MLQTNQDVVENHFLPLNAKSDLRTYWLSQVQWSILARNWKSAEQHGSDLVQPTLADLHEKEVYLSKIGPRAITPWAGVIVTGSGRGGGGGGGGSVSWVSNQEEI